MDGRKLRTRPCAICGNGFRPDPRVGRRQHTCCDANCQAEWRSRTQARWRQRNPEYWRLPRAKARRERAAQEGERLMQQPGPPSLRTEDPHTSPRPVGPGEALMLWLRLDLRDLSMQDSMIATRTARTGSEADLRDHSTQDSMIATRPARTGSEADLRDLSMQDPIPSALGWPDDPA